MTNNPPSLRVTILSAALCVTVSAWRAPMAAAQGPNGGKATNITRVHDRSASFLLDDGDRYATLTVTMDEIANTTFLSYAYRFPDPTQNDPNLLVQIQGDGEIPNSAFTTTAGSARLTVTTPDSYPVTRCVINNFTGEYTCAPTAPSTFDVVWTETGEWAVREATTSVDSVGTVTTRIQGRFNESTASVSGMWDGHSSTSLTGDLSESQNVTRVRGIAWGAQAPLLTPSAVRGRAEALNGGAATKASVNNRSAFSFLEGGGLNGFVSVVKDEISNVTLLEFSYAFLDPTDSSSILLFQGHGVVPNSAFTITSASARLTATTPDSYPVFRCVINALDSTVFTCAPTGPSTFDLTWTQDGYEALREMATRVETSGLVTTRSSTQYNRVTANVNGTWNGHAAANMMGNLANYHLTTISRGSTAETNP